MHTNVRSVIDAEHAAFMESGVSISVAACNPDRLPSQVRATGCRVAADRTRVTVFVSATQASALLADVRSNGVIAVVFSKPTTHRTVQIKGTDAQVTGLIDGDLQCVDRYRIDFATEVAPLGFGGPLIRTLLACPAADIVALRFTPSEAYSQTPGPRAGEPLKAAT
ncbi:hypothetical protein D3870_08985 [Noviherbaspirillum cavernae]|uniref:Uncharacterized protein n=1 Tax=Noviherbaspirillum cavernae TaxID=2320862 RepID=A0A418X0V5_9BURK|nr:pyridoxamine 5'-phosphate oxidase family protein [Noviherbaspirillum cavernae]RJG06120.1 hypothetical protein D3870_08985 [Noviherbaspirillum cavernae]